MFAEQRGTQKCGEVPSWDTKEITDNQSTSRQWGVRIYITNEINASEEAMISASPTSIIRIIF